MGRRRFRFRLSGGALVVQERFRVRNIPVLQGDVSDLSAVGTRQIADVSDISLSRWVTAKYEGMGEIVGFWDSAVDEAGKEYGRRHAGRIARWKLVQRYAGYALIGALVLFGAARAYVPALFSTSAVRYGLIALVLSIGTVLIMYMVVRTVRASRRTSRAVRTEVYNELYNDEPVHVQREVYDGRTRTRTALVYDDMYKDRYK